MRWDLLAIVGCVLLFFKEGEAVQCYQCDSETNPDCTEQFDHLNPDLRVKSYDCSVDAAEFCIKTTGVWGGVVGTTRFCSSRDMGNQCQYIRYPDHDRVYRACIFTCESDHCNGAPAGINFSLALLLFTALSTIVWNLSSSR